MKRMQLGMAMLAAATIGSLTGWFRPIPLPSSMSDHEQQVSWQLPSAATLERSSAALSSRAQSLRWAGDAAPDGASDFSVQDWTLKAILNRDEAILIQSGKDSLISRTEVGASLPDGSRLLALKGDIAVIELDGCRIDKHLYPRASNSNSSECKAPTSHTDTQQP